MQVAPAALDHALQHVRAGSGTRPGGRPPAGCRRSGMPKPLRMRCHRSSGGVVRSMVGIGGRSSRTSCDGSGSRDMRGLRRGAEAQRGRRRQFRRQLQRLLGMGGAGQQKQQGRNEAAEQGHWGEAGTMGRRVGQAAAAKRRQGRGRRRILAMAALRSVQDLRSRPDSVTLAQRAATGPAAGAGRRVRAFRFGEIAPLLLRMTFRA